MKRGASWRMVYMAVQRVAVTMPKYKVHMPPIIEERSRIMKLNKEIEIIDFLKAIKQARGNVWLTSAQGDRYNLKSTLSRYVAIGALINDYGNELELFCDNTIDEGLFYEFFEQHPDVL